MMTVLHFAVVMIYLQNRTTQLKVQAHTDNVYTHKHSSLNNQSGHSRVERWIKQRPIMLTSHILCYKSQSGNDRSMPEGKDGMLFLKFDNKDVFAQHA